MEPATAFETLAPNARSETLPIYGLLAEFETPTALVEAIHETRRAGYVRLDAYTPFPVEEVTEAMGVKRTRLPLVVFIGGLVGAGLGYFMQYYWAAWAYGEPFNVGGRPAHSAPAFVPITFEMTILLAALAAVLGMLALNRLPMPYHPVFNVPRFALATRDRFFLCIEAADPQFDLARTREFLNGLHPREVTEVPP